MRTMFVLWFVRMQPMEKILCVEHVCIHAKPVTLTRIALHALEACFFKDHAWHNALSEPLLSPTFKIISIIKFVKYVHKIVLFVFR